MSVVLDELPRLVFDFSLNNFQYSRTSRVTDPTVTDCSGNRTLKLNKYLVSIIKIVIKRVRV